MSILHTFSVCLSLLLSQFPAVCACVSVCRFPTPLPHFRSSSGPVPAGPTPPTPSSQELPGRAQLPHPQTRGHSPEGELSLVAPGPCPLPRLLQPLPATGAMNGRLRMGWILDVRVRGGEGHPGQVATPGSPWQDPTAPVPAVPWRARALLPAPTNQSARAAQRVLPMGWGGTLCTASANQAGWKGPGGIPKRTEPARQQVPRQ